MMGWQWHQLDHMQIICTSLQTDNHASTLPLRQDTLPAAQPAASKQLTQMAWLTRNSSQTFWDHRLIQIYSNSGTSHRRVQRI